MMLHGKAFVEGGFRPVIVKEGPKWSQYVHLDANRVRVGKAKGKLDVRPLQGYTLQQMASRFLQRTNVLGNKMAISRTARKLLTEAKQS